jgi:hypothetical protein
MSARSDSVTAKTSSGFSQQPKRRTTHPPPDPRGHSCLPRPTSTRSTLPDRLRLDSAHLATSATARVGPRIARETPKWETGADIETNLAFISHIRIPKRGFFCGSSPTTIISDSLATKRHRRSNGVPTPSRSRLWRVRPTPDASVHSRRWHSRTHATSEYAPPQITPSWPSRQTSSRCSGLALSLS